MICAASHPLFAELMANFAYALSIHFVMGILIYAIRRY